MPSLPAECRALTLVALIATVAVACEDKAPAPPPLAAEAPQRPLMVVFSRDYCTPCQVMKPWVDEIARENPHIDVATVNVDRSKYERIGNYFKVSAVPSLLYASANGQVVRRTEGLAKKQQMAKALKELGWTE